MAFWYFIFVKNFVDKISRNIFILRWAVRPLGLFLAHLDKTKGHLSFCHHLACLPLSFEKFLYVHLLQNKWTWNQRLLGFSLGGHLSKVVSSNLAGYQRWQLWLLIGQKCQYLAIRVHTSSIRPSVYTFAYIRVAINH